MEALKILLIGIDYFSNLGSGDKNFWYHLVPHLVARGNDLTVISFNYRSVGFEIQQTDHGEVRIINIRPSHLGVDLRPDPSLAHNSEKCHSHFKSPPRSPVEYWLSFLRIRPLIQRLVREYNITNVHCMDNFGPAMHLLRHWVAPVPVSVSAMGYYARAPFHDWYLKYCFQGLDAIVPFSEAYARKMSEFGLSEQKVCVIPWGIDPHSIEEIAQPEERAGIKQRLGIESDQSLVFWTGFIQQIREKELYLSMEIAQSLVSRRKDVHLVFALKPECYRSKYERFVSPRIKLLVTNISLFRQLLRAADYLLSPIINTNSIVTPPLTWIEAMAVGMPIVTNRVLGVETVITNGQSGFVADTIADFLPLLEHALSYPGREEMREEARKHILNHYTIPQAATGYQTLWQRLREGSLRVNNGTQ